MSKKSRAPLEVTQEFIDAMDVYRVPDASKSGLLSACAANVVVFASHMLGIRLYAWQVYFLQKLQRACEQERLPRKYIAMTSRQIGKSTAVSVFSIWACVFNKYPGTLNKNTIVGITSASDVQAKKLLRNMKMLMMRGSLYMRQQYVDEQGNPKFGSEFFDELLSLNDPNNTANITFRPYNKAVDGDVLLVGSMAGSVIKSYPPTPTILGETFTVIIIDEAGRSDEITDEFFKEVISPTGNSTNALRIYLSTPWQQSGFFYELVDPHGVYPDNDVDLSIFTIDAIQIEDSKYYNNVKIDIDEMNARGDTAEVQRAYYCRFVKGDTSFFDGTKVIEAFDKSLVASQSYQGQCDMGIDFGGQSKSKTVITISELQKDTIVRLFHKSYAVGEDLKLLDDVEVLLTKFNVQRIIPDDCPQADFLIRAMVDKGWNIQPVSDNGVRKRYGMNFRTDKVKKYTAFRSMLHKGLVKSYPDKQLQTEMLALEQSEKVRNSTIEPPPGYTDDYVDSFLLSSYFYLQDDTRVKTYEF